MQQMSRRQFLARDRVGDQGCVAEVARAAVDAEADALGASPAGRSVILVAWVTAAAVAHVNRLPQAAASCGFGPTKSSLSTTTSVLKRF